MAMIKILFIVECLNTGGTELSMLKWITNRDKKAFDAMVISLRDGELKRELISLGINTQVLIKRCPFDLFFLIKLAKMVKKLKPDIVHCRNGITAISYGVLAAKICGISVISSIHGRTHYIKSGFRIEIWLWILNLSNLIIAVSNKIKEELAKLDKINDGKIKVIYNGIDIKESEENNLKPSMVRDDFGLVDNDFVIGTIGNLRKIKGHCYLIKSMVSILQEIPHAKLALVGDGEERNDLERLAKSLNIEDKVIFLGYRRNAKEFIRLFDIFVLPSLSEGFPNVLLESAVNKRPIIATRVGGIEEVVRNGYSALLVEKANSEALAEKVLELKNNPALGNMLTENAYNDTLNNFSLNKFMKGYERNYIDVANYGKEDYAIQ